MPTIRRTGLAALATGLVLGGSALTAGTAHAEADVDFTRLKGENRYATSAAAAEAFGPASTVILASGEAGSYPDALTANYLAGVEDAPVLLTKHDTTPQAVLDAIRDSGARRIIIVGGEAAVSSAQQDALEEDYTVDRLAGSDRFGTAAEIIAAAAAGDQTDGNVALLATGMNFPDALGAGPVAFAEQMPLAITKVEDIPDQVVAELKDAGITEVLILGGESAVGPEVVEELKAKGITVAQRFNGEDRAETSVLLAKHAQATYEGFDGDAVNVASGYTSGDGADALGGAPLTGQQTRPLLITKSDDTAGDEILEYLRGADELTGGTIFGGQSALAGSVEVAMEKAVLGSGAQNAGTGELYDTVSEAIADAKEGDTITVFGDANEGFTVDKAGLTIRGENGATVTGAIQVQGVDGVTVRGLTITPGTVTNQVSGIYLNDAADVLIAGNLIERDTRAGAGIINVIGGEPEVAEVRNNTFRGLTQGVYANPSAEFTIVDNVFQDNAAASANDAASVIRDNRFLNNDEAIGLGAAGVVVESNDFGADNDVHVKDYVADTADYDLQAMIEDNSFDTDVVVDEDAPLGPEIVNAPEEEPTPAAEPTGDAG